MRTNVFQHYVVITGISYDFFDIGEFWYCKSQVNDFGMATRFFKYERVSLIGAVALKAGFSVVTITTPSNPSPTDLPNLRSKPSHRPKYTDMMLSMLL